jgi:molybdate transport system permease protein
VLLVQAQEAFVQFAALLFHHADDHLDAGITKHLHTFASHQRVRIEHAHYHASDTFLDDQFGIQAVHTWLGCILAATVIAFPLMYRNARAAFEQLDANLVYAGRTLGMSETAIFWRIVVPAAGPGIASGTILTFARAMGEYGATSMLAGNIPGKTGTVSQRIAMVIQDGDYMTAGFWVAVVLLIALAVIVAVNLFAGRRERAEKRW